MGSDRGAQRGPARAAPAQRSAADSTAGSAAESAELAVARQRLAEVLGRLRQRRRAHSVALIAAGALLGVVAWRWGVTIGACLLQGALGACALAGLASGPGPRLESAARWLDRHTGARDARRSFAAPASAGAGLDGADLIWRSFLRAPQEPFRTRLARRTGAAVPGPLPARLHPACALVLAGAVGLAMVPAPRAGSRAQSAAGWRVAPAAVDTSAAQLTRAAGSSHTAQRPQPAPASPPKATLTVPQILPAPPGAQLPSAQRAGASQRSGHAPGETLAVDASALLRDGAQRAEALGMTVRTRTPAGAQAPEGSPQGEGTGRAPARAPDGRALTLPQAPTLDRALVPGGDRSRSTPALAPDLIARARPGPLAGAPSGDAARADRTLLLRDGQGRAFSRLERDYLLRAEHALRALRAARGAPDSPQPRNSQAQADTTSPGGKP